MKPKIRVFVIDDSATVRSVLRDILARDVAIEVIGSAADPLFAADKLKRDWPDVFVLDVEMPRMDGIAYLKKIMSERPTPVVICSTLTSQGARTTMQAFAAGAVAVIEKPKAGVKSFLVDAADDLIQVIKTAAKVSVHNLQLSTVGASPPPPPPPKFTADQIIDSNPSAKTCTSERIVAIGASTGGTQALEAVLRGLPRDCPGIVIVQHMPEKFTAAFSERLNEVCQISVREARNGDQIVAGHAFIAPGGHHLLVRRSGTQYFTDVVDGPPVNRHRPSVDVLFRSVANFAGKNALGVIMTGMGADGALGLKEMQEAGSRTIAQDEASCVVFGMPKEAIKLGAADRVAGIHDIVLEVISFGHRS